ncbi:MAG: extracellular solute-binding protein [Chloroflexota bacterium]|nr:extracellular solute-binding protein [Chloroflexota bacterium]
MDAGTRISRRRLLELAIAGGGASLLAACGGGAPAAPPAQTAPNQPAAPNPTRAPVVTEIPTTVPNPAAAQAPTAVPTATTVPNVAYTGGTKVLMRVHWGGTYYNEFAKVVNEYNTTQGPQDKIYITLERQLQPQNGANEAAGLLATFIADFQAGTSEDIYHNNDNILPELASRNFFVPAPQSVTDAVKRDWRGGTFETGSWDGKFYGYPTEYQAMALLVNKKLFEDGTGLTLPKDAPKNWDDLRAKSKAVAKKDGSGRITRQGLIWKTEDFQRQMIERVVLHQADGEPFIDTSGGGIPKINFLSPTSMKLMNLYKGMVDDGSMVGGVGGENVLLPNRLGTMDFAEAFAVYFFLKALGDENIVNEQYAIKPFSSDGSKTITNTRNYHFQVAARSKVQDQAWTFLKWLNEGPEFRMANFQVDVFGFLPAVKSIELPKWWPDEVRTTWKELLDGQTVPIPNILGLAQIIELVGTYQNQVILGQASIEDAMTKADAEAKKVLQDAYR